MWQKIKDWFDKINWWAVIDSQFMLYFFPLVVFTGLVFTFPDCVFAWLALILWIVVFVRNYEK